MNINAHTTHLRIGVYYIAEDVIPKIYYQQWRCMTPKISEIDIIKYYFITTIARILFL